MTDDVKVQIYRSENEKVRSLNDAGFDLAELCDQVVGLPEEGTKYVFPVRAQLTYYRLLHPHGMIHTEIIKQDEFQAQVKATVYSEDGKALATSHGMATANADGARGFQMLPTAESRAIGRALGFAGFGCQLRIQAYDGDDFVSSQPATMSDTEMEQSPPNIVDAQPVPAAVPDSINTRLKVPANDEKRVLDVRELDEPTTRSKPLQRRRKKEDAEDAPATAEQPDDPTEPRAEPVESLNAPFVEMKKETTDIDATCQSDETLTTEERIEAFMESTCNEPLPTLFDPDFFGVNYSGDIDPNAAFVNAKGQQTQVCNGMLQRMISFFMDTQGELQKQIKAPVISSSPNYNKTLGELIEEGEMGKSVVRLCSEAYRKDSPAILAGVLVCAKLYCAA